MRYLIALIITIAVIIFVIIRLLSGGGGDKQQLQVNTSLSSYGNTDTVMRYSIDNAVQAPQDHRRLSIVVGRDNATLTISKGYEGEVITNRSYLTGQAAYNNFLLSLERSGGYTLGNADEALQDERGYCATGERFLYEIVKSDGSLIQHYWSTTCKEKTFKGLPDVVRELFENQIPDFGELTQDVDI